METKNKKKKFKFDKFNYGKTLIPLSRRFNKFPSSFGNASGSATRTCLINIICFGIYKIENWEKQNI